jgi:hypothetical protein
MSKPSFFDDVFNIVRNQGGPNYVTNNKVQPETVNENKHKYSFMWTLVQSLSLSLPPSLSVSLSVSLSLSLSLTNIRIIEYFRLPSEKNHATPQMVCNMFLFIMTEAKKRQHSLFKKQLTSSNISASTGGHQHCEQITS